MEDQIRNTSLENLYGYHKHLGLLPLTFFFDEGEQLQEIMVAMHIGSLQRTSYGPNFRSGFA
jgi:hypothetical protein